MPVPQPLQLTGKGRAVLFSRPATWSGVSFGLAESISAATPLTTGAAIEVPM